MVFFCVDKLLREILREVKLIKHFLKVAELRLRLRAGSLYLVHGRHCTFEHGCKIGRVNPIRNDDQKNDVQEYFDETSDEGIPPHCVKHAVIIFRQTIHLLQLLLVWFHEPILPCRMLELVRAGRTSAR